MADTLETILAEWEKDAEIDSTEPGKELLKIPKLHSKYLKILVTTRIKLKQIRNEHAETKKIRWKYYAGHLNSDKDMLSDMGLEPFKFVLKQDAPIYIDSDKELIKFTDKITYYEEMAKACEMILQELKNRTWEIRSFIDF